MRKQYMKTLKFYIGLLLFTMIIGCTSDKDELVEPIQKGISFNIHTIQLSTRANSDFTIGTIDLLICNEQEEILQKVRAVGSGSSYTATAVIHSPEKRIVHFIANYNSWDSDANIIGKDAREVLAGITTTDFVAWKRIELTNGIVNTTPFSGFEPIELICNMACFTLQVDGLTNVSFAIYNYDRGTITTFNPQTYKFQENLITIPAKVEMKIPTIGDFVNAKVGASGTPSEKFFTFERRNSKSATNYSCMIVKGDLSGTTYYYKIDLIDNNDVRQDIIRNYSYNMVISRVDKTGSSSITAAINGAAANINFTLDENMEIYPSITDGLHKLEVNNNLIVVTDASQTANFKATYSKKNGSTWETVSGKFQNPVIKPIDGYAPAVSSASIDNNGNVTVNIKSLSSEEKQSKIQISVNDGGKKFYRTVNIVIREAYILNIVDTNKNSGQGSEQTVTLQIPSDFPKEKLPINLHFKTNDYFPHKDTPMRFTSVGGTPVYIYTIPETYNPGENLTLKFRSNKEDSNESVEISATYFQNKTFQF